MIPEWARTRLARCSWCSVSRRSFSWWQTNQLPHRRPLVPGAGTPCQSLATSRAAAAGGHCLCVGLAREREGREREEERGREREGGERRREGGRERCLFFLYPRVCINTVHILLKKNISNKYNITHNPIHYIHVYSSYQSP